MDGLTLISFGIPGGWEWIAIVIVALLIFGRRLPEVARSVGRSIVEFKKGVRDAKDEIDVSSDLNSTKKLEKKEEPRSRSSEETDHAPSKSTPNEA